MDKVLNFLPDIMRSVENFFASVRQTGGVPEATLTVIFFIICVIWLSSGFFAATIAEVFGHGVWKHFFLGLLLPFIYPAYLARHIGMKVAAIQEAEDYMATAGKAEAHEMISERFASMRENRRAERRENVAERRMATTGEVMSAEELAAVVPEKNLDLSRPSSGVSESNSSGELSDFAKSIYDALWAIPAETDGSRQCSLLLEMAGNAKVRIIEIKSMKDNFMICTLADSGKTMRIMYEKLNGIEEI